MYSINKFNWSDQYSLYFYSSVGKKQEDVQSKFIYYPVNAKVAAIHQIPSYNSEEEPAKLPVKTTVSHSNYHIVRPVIKHSTGGNTEYKNTEVSVWKVKYFVMNCKSIRKLKQTNKQK